MLVSSIDLAKVKRPKLLVRAARLAAENLQRKSVLQRIFEGMDIPNNVLPDLAAVETDLNQKRKSGDADYSIARHVTVLAALMHEAEISPT